MARISSFTVFVWVTLIVYTIVAGAMVSVVTGTTYTSPYTTTITQEGQMYRYSEIHNITKGTQVDYAANFTPDRRVRWNIPLFPDRLGFYRKDTWLGLVWWQMQDSPITEAEIIADFDTSKNYSKYSFDYGGAFWTDVYVYPYMYGNGSFVYYPINNSIANNKLTILLGTNQTSYTYFDIGILTGIVTGYNSYGAPAEVSIVIAGIWWILLVLGIVKLVIG